MKNFYDIKDSDLSSSLRTIKYLMQKHGWKGVQLAQGKERLFVGIRPDGRKIFFPSCSAPTASAFGLLAATDKLVSYYIMKELGVSQPDTVLLCGDSAHIRKQLEDTLAKHSRIVIKPLDCSHGNGVHTDITDLESATKAVNEVLKTSDKILAQEQLMVDDYEIRAICIDYKFVAAFARIPAQVTGDGEHTVTELVKIENSTIRTKPYRSDLAYITESMSNDYLSKNHLSNYVPKKGEKVQVIRMCNVGRGGTARNVSDAFPENLKRLSEKIAKKFELPVIGIDFLEDKVLEVNGQPSTYYPTGDNSSTFCVERYVEYLESC